MGLYRSTKIFEGYSTVFRQWGSKHSHCKFLHGYALKFKVTFEGELDNLNWVCDFGCFKNNGIKDHLSYMFDHTTIIAENDPFLIKFKELEKKGVIQLRILKSVGCEKFAQLIHNTLSEMLHVNKHNSLNPTVKLKSVEVFEHGANSAIYEE